MLTADAVARLVRDNPVPKNLRERAAALRLSFARVARPPKLPAEPSRIAALAERVVADRDRMNSLPTSTPDEEINRMGDALAVLEYELCDEPARTAADLAIKMRAVAPLFENHVSPADPGMLSGRAWLGLRADIERLARGVPFDAALREAVGSPTVAACPAARLARAYGAEVEAATEAEEAEFDAREARDNLAEERAAAVAGLASERAEHLLRTVSMERAASLGGALFQVAVMANEAETIDSRAGRLFTHADGGAILSKDELERENAEIEHGRRRIHRLAYSVRAALLAHGADPLPGALTSLLPDTHDVGARHRAAVAHLLREA